MSATRRAASSRRAGMSRKCAVSPRSAAATTMPQRSRTAAAVKSCAASSVVEGTAPDAAQFLGVADPRRCEIAGGFLGLDLDRRVERYEAFRDRDLLPDLDALRGEGIALEVRHRYPAVDAADAEPMKNVRHQFLEPHVLYAGDAFGAAKIGIWAIAARLALAGVVDEEFGDLAKGSPFLAVVDDNPDPAPLRGLDADLDAVHEIRPARANVGAEHVRAVTLVMHSAGDHATWLGDLLDGAEEVNRRAADRRQEHLDVGPGDELREHAAGFLEQGAPQIVFGDAKARRQPGEMPYWIDRRLGDADLAVGQQHLPVGRQAAVGEQRPQFGSDDLGPGDRYRRAYVDAGANMFGEHLPGEVAPRIERDDFRWVGPLRLPRNQSRRRGVGEIGPMVPRQRPGGDGERPIDCVGPRI